MKKTITSADIKNIRGQLLEALENIEFILEAHGTPEQESYGHGYYKGCSDTVVEAIRIIDNVLGIHREDL